MKKTLSYFALLLSVLMLQSCSPKVSALKEGDTLHGFVLKKKEFVKDHDSMVYLFEHQKTGAKLVNMKNSDNNRVFAISFNTFPHDHTGKAHILEHSVLMGSKKYPSKNTFEELAKGSFTTYLNAFTSPDMTTYPVATINHKEFKNLMQVYLDAVFFPNIHGDPNLMKQEGIRLEYNQDIKRLEYKGVVFNEMKGVMGKPETVINDLTKQLLYPNSTYTYISGGDPKFIPDLTQQSLADFHLQFYHPSNSYTFIYGDEEIEEHLKYIDKFYFSRFEKKTIKMENQLATPISKPIHHSGYYSINHNESVKGKYYYTKNYLTTPANQTDDHLGLALLARLLTKNQTSPLSKMLIDQGLGTQIYAYHSTYLPWANFLIAADKAEAAKRSIFEQTIERCLRKIVQIGFDPAVVEGEIRTFEFSLKEMDTGRTPMGIELLGGVKRSLAYDLDLFDRLRYLDKIEKLKLQVKDPNYFKQLITKYLLNNPRTLTLEVKPSPGLAMKEELEEKSKLDKLLTSLDKQQLETIKMQTKEFAEYQAKPSSEADLKAIPKLSLRDIDELKEVIPQKVILDQDTTILYYPLHTKGITYLDINFDLQFLSEEQIPYANLILHLLENLRTKNLSLQQLQQEKALHTGYAYNRAVATELFKKKGYNPRFKYIVGTLDQNLSQSLDFIYEIIAHTDYRDYKELRHYLKNIQADVENQFMSNPGELGSSTLRAMNSQAGAYQYQLAGLPFYRFVQKLNANFAKEKETIAKNLELTAQAIFHQRNIVISATAGEEKQEEIVSQIKQFIKRLPMAQDLKPYTIAPLKKERLAIIVPDKVQYVSLLGKLNQDEEMATSGSLDVLLKIVEDEFLHPEIRQVGGAYGAYAFSGLKGDITFLSYRDPEIERTIETFRRSPKFLQQYSYSADDLEKFIIGTVKDFDAPKSNKQKGAAMTSRYLFNYTLSDREKYRSQIIKADSKELQNYAKQIEQLLKQSNYAVVGSEAEIRKSAPLFDRIIYLFE